MTRTSTAPPALNALGVGPGDSIACVGARACLYDIYWARLAGVRILTEVYLPQPPLYPALAAMPNHDLAIDAVRGQGAKVMVGYFSPGLMTGVSPLTAGWRELGESPFYALPLNLPPRLHPWKQPRFDPRATSSEQRAKSSDPGSNAGICLVAFNQ